MQEVFCYFVGILVAAWAVALIACPDRLLPELGGKKKRFSARHWGCYQENAALLKDGSAEANEANNEETIEVGIPAKKIKHVVGSQTYAGGRGVSMRGG